MKILFQGDSITDANRDRRNYHDVGQGYPKFASEIIKAEFPETDFEFINFGIGGTRTHQLFERIYVDGIAFQPDVFSILVGINDVWHRYSNQKILMTDEQIELSYRRILERVKSETNAKIIVLAPFLLDCPEKEHLRADVEKLVVLVKKLADEFADAYIPLDEKFAEALKVQPEPQYYSADGVHPNDNGREFIGKLYAEAALPLIKQLI